MTAHQDPSADAESVHDLPAAGDTSPGEVPPAPTPSSDRSLPVQGERVEGVNSRVVAGEGGTPAAPTALAAMRLGILSALDQIEEREQANDYGSLAVGALAAKSLRGDLSLVEREAKHACRRVLDSLEADRRTEVPLQGHSLTLERDSGVKRTEWRTMDLFVEVLRRSIVDRDTGEVLSTDERGDARIAAVLSCFSLTPKVTGLRELGIDPADFCVEAREKSVRITGGLS